MPPPQTSERRFLDAQAEVAASAMVRTVHDLKETLATMTDVRSGAQRHPWILAGAAVAIGFVTGVLLPSSRQNAVTHMQPTSEADVQPCRGKQKTRTKKSAAITSAGRALFSLLQSFVQGWITTVLFSKGKTRTDMPSPRGSTEAVILGGAVIEQHRHEEGAA
ncbi:MAG: hypothetical protein HOP29_13915 [Phycisphaerales bacterium]|nr:hypothetical protein [Phycisphaerales bacterium]